MASYQHELFQRLINRLQLNSTDQKCLRNGLFTKLIIHDRSHLWSFHVTLASILPYKIFQNFMHHLHNKFKSLSIRIFIHVDRPKMTGTLIQNYWPWVIRHCGLSTLMDQQLMKNGRLKVTDNNVSLDTHDEALKGFLINGALTQIEDMYHQLGFPAFKVNVPGSRANRKLPAKLVAFKIKKNVDDIKLARAAVKALDQDTSK